MDQATLEKYKKIKGDLYVKLFSFQMRKFGVRDYKWNTSIHSEAR